MLSINHPSFVYRPVLMMVVLLTTTLTGTPRALNADDGPALLERLLTQYLEYQNIELTGTVTVKEPDKDLVTHQFVMRFGASVAGKLPPQDARLLKPNPGEPHINDELVTDFGYGYSNDGIAVQFNRKYVSKEPVSPRLSNLYLSVSPPSPIQPFDAITQAVLFSVEGTDPRGYWAIGSTVRSATDLEVLGSEEFLGVSCKRVRYRIVTVDDPNWTPLAIEALVATEPTVQVLKILSVSGGSPGYLDKEMLHTYLGGRSVESVRRVGDWLVCDKIVVTGGEYRTEVSITDVQPLAKNYEGLWDYNALTGCLVGGTAEPSTRKASARIPYPHSKEFTIAPYTDEEFRLINEYVAAAGSAPSSKPGFSGMKVALLLGNLFAIGLIVFYVRKAWRK